MNDFHGLIFAYSAAPELRELVSKRTAASLPFCGRYRLIDFSLSSLMNAGIRDVGVIMQRDYQSLLDHLGGGKSWDMSRKDGGLRILPPFGLPEYHTGRYSGSIEALNAVASYVRSIPQKHIVLLRGNMCVNIDVAAAMKQHLRSGAPITAICNDQTPEGTHYRFVVGEDGMVSQLLSDREGDAEGIASLESYIVEKETLLAIMDSCKARNLHRLHKDALANYLKDGGKMAVYVHEGYAKAIRTVDAYYAASADMLCGEKRAQVFPADRPVRTKNHEGVSTYYGENSVSRNSLVADNCIIEGEIENCVIFSGVRIGKGAKLKNCIVMRRCVVGDGSQLSYVIADKGSKFAAGTVLTGNEKLPVVAPKNSNI